MKVTFLALLIFLVRKCGTNPSGSSRGETSSSGPSSNDGEDGDQRVAAVPARARSRTGHAAKVVAVSGTQTKKGRRSTTHRKTSRRRESTRRAESPLSNVTSDPDPPKKDDKEERLKIDESEKQNEKLDISQFYENFKRNEALPPLLRRVQTGSTWSSQIGDYVKFRRCIRKHSGNVEVCFVTHTPTKTRCVVKIVRVGAEAAVCQALTEIHVLAHMTPTDYVVRLFHAFVDNVAYTKGDIKRSICIVMEYVPGMNLNDVTSSRRYTVDETFARPIVRQISAAITAFHRRGYIHGDIKPENIILHDEGADVAAGYGDPSSSATDKIDIKRAVVIDVGIAQEIVKDDGFVPTIGGSPDYFAPEILFNRKQNRAADFWALGVLTHELLIKRRPFAVEEMMFDAQYFTPQEFRHFKKEFSAEFDALTIRSPLITDCGKAFVKALLRVDWTTRLGITADVDTHEWLNDEVYLEQRTALDDRRRTRWIAV